jgi:hypothetical protein
MREDPEYRAEVERHQADLAERVRRSRAAELPLLADLHAIEIELDTVWPPIMMVPRTDIRLRTAGGSGRTGVELCMRRTAKQHQRSVQHNLMIFMST